MQYPLLYQEGVQNVLFNWTQIIGWMVIGICNAITIFFLCTIALQHQAFRKGGEVVDREILGATLYTCIVWVVNCQMALSVSYFTLFQHIFIWGGIALWYIFLLVYGAMTPKVSATAFMVFIEDLANAPSYWIVTLFVVISTLIPYITFTAVRVRFFPMYHERIQWIRFNDRAAESEYSCEVRQRSERLIMAGVSARLEAKISQIRSRVHHAVQTL